jgi:hypothetical protein
MSPRSSSARKPQGPAAAPDVYVSLLFVAVASLCVGCALLAMELNAYQWSLPGGV